MNGKCVIVTGGATLIGAGVVEAFRAAGASVVIADIDRAGGTDLAGRLGPDVLYQHTDVTDDASIEACVAVAEATFGGVDCLVNLACSYLDDGFASGRGDWHKALDVNLVGAVMMARAAVPAMERRGGGAIVNFGSTSWMIGQGGMPAYTAAKSAVLGLTRSLARDFGEHNIRVNAIAPGWIMTQRQIDLWLTPESEAELMRRQCLKRRLVPEDIARATLFFASEEAGACTNQHYVVDGGWV